jgi:MFS family permease
VRQAELSKSEGATFNVWRGAVAGACASLVGIGLARFAYTPLLPAIIGAHWFPASTAAYLGAANLGGYLAGALAAGPLARRANTATVLRAMMLLATIAFVACAFPVSFLWFFIWRLASGLSGGALMVRYDA